MIAIIMRPDPSLSDRAKWGVAPLIGKWSGIEPELVWIMRDVCPVCWNAADSSMIMFWCYKWHKTWHYLINTLPGTTLSSLRRVTVIQIYATRYLAHRDYRALAPGRFASLWCDLFHLFRLRYKIWFVWDEDTDQSCLSLSKPRQCGQWSCSFIPVLHILLPPRHRKPWDTLMKSDPSGCEVWNADPLWSIHLPALARIISLKGFIFQWSSPPGCWLGFSKLQGFFCHGVGSDHTSSFSQWLWSHIALDHRRVSDIKPSAIHQSIHSFFS